MVASQQSARGGLATLFATSLIQIMASFAVSAPLTVSIAIVGEAHLPEAWIGYYTSLLYLSAMTGSLLTPRLIASLDVGRIQLGGLVATMLGFALFAEIAASGRGLALALAGIVIMGLAYGVIVPASLPETWQISSLQVEARPPVDPVSAAREDRRHSHLSAESRLG